MGSPSAALGFDHRRLFRLVAFLLEELDGFVEAHLAGVHLDADDKAGVAQQCVLQLTEAQELGFALILGAGAGLAVAIVEHHLLGIVRPSFDVGVRAKDLADAARRLQRPQDTGCSGRDRLRVLTWR